MAAHHDQAVVHLRRRDPVMRRVIDQVGPFTLRPQRNRFWMLVRSILSQQVSSAAAMTIRARVEALVGDLTAENLARTPLAKLRTAGVSPQKSGYLVDLCQAEREGRISLARIGRKSDEEVIEELIQVKGIGRWTAQMFLIFALGRMDVYPHDDLGVRSAMRDLYSLADLPDFDSGHEIAARWRPYASVASWYCWRSADLKRPGPTPTKKPARRRRA